MTLVPQWMIGMRNSEMVIAVAKPNGNALTDAPDDLDLYISSAITQMVMRGVVQGPFPKTIIHAFGNGLSVFPNQISTAYDSVGVGYLRPYSYGWAPLTWASIRCENNQFIVDEVRDDGTSTTHTGPDVNYFAFNYPATIS